MYSYTDQTITDWLLVPTRQESEILVVLERRIYDVVEAHATDLVRVTGKPCDQYYPVTGITPRVTLINAFQVFLHSTVVGECRHKLVTGCGP